MDRLAVKEGGMKALALVEARDHVCCRYRIAAFDRALRASGWSLATEPLAPGLFGRLAQFRRAADHDVVILQRKLLPGWQLAELRRRARRLIFDFDDAVLYRDSYDPRGPHHRRRRARFERTVRLADTVIAGNDFLAGRAVDAGARADRVRVIPTCVDTDAARPAPRPRGDARPGIDLVWIGSGSTMAGLEQQRPTWERVGREVPGVRLRMICDQFLRFDALEVVAVPWALATQDAAVAAGDVGISWVPDDLWSRGKCGLKVLQYQAAGLPVVTNPVGVHAGIVRPGVDGFLATTADDWVAAIRTLATDPELRRRQGRAARAAVEANYSVATWSASFVAALAGAGPPAPPASRRVVAPARPKILAGLE